MEHPITPPPELVAQWTAIANEEESCKVWSAIATQAARWGADQQLKLDAEQIAHAYQAGADQELEACTEWLRAAAPAWERRLRAARRPKAPNLKEQALARLTSLEELAESMGHSPDDTIRQLLEALPND